MFKILFTVIVTAMIAIPSIANERVIGIAELESGIPLYREVHLIGETVHTVKYLTEDDQLIATNTLDYTDSQTAPGFEQHNLVMQTRQGGRWVDGRYELFSGNESKPIKFDPPLVASSGFNRFLLANMDSLRAGDPVSFEFAVPDRLNSVRLKAVPDGSDQQGHVVVKLKAASALLSLFVPNIQVTYDADNRLREFNGVSNIEIDGRKPQVRIRYYYDEEGSSLDRMPQSSPTGE